MWISQNLKAIGSDLEMYMDGREVSVDIAKGYRWRLEMMLRDLVAMETCGELNSCETEALNYLSQAHFTMIQVVENLSKDPVPDSASATMQAPVILSGSIGRPKFDIRRRMTEFNLSVHETYAPISDSDLDRIVEETQQIFPNWGNRLMYGYLISSGLRVQFHRVQESQSRVDPEGSFMRRLSTLNRLIEVCSSRTSVAVAYRRKPQTHKVITSGTV